MGTALYQLMAVQAFRPDRLVASGVCLVEATLGEKFMSSLDKDVDLGAVVANEVPFACVCVSWGMCSYLYH